MRRYQVKMGCHDRGQMYQIIMEAASTADLLEQLEAQPRLRLIWIEELGEIVTQAFERSTDGNASRFKRYVLIVVYTL